MTAASATASDWAQARTKRLAGQALLPDSLKTILVPIRDHSLAISLLTDIRQRVYEIARSRGWVQGRDKAVGGRAHLLRAREHLILEELGRNHAYLGHLRSTVATALRAAHLTRLDPGQVEEVHVPYSTPYEVKGTRLFVDSEAGLGTASMLEGEPEGWPWWLVDDYLHRSGLSMMDAEVLSLSKPPTVHVLVLGAGPGGVPRAAVSRPSSGASFSIRERDWCLPERTCVDGVQSRNAALDRQTFDLVALIMPAPATPSAAQHRACYRSDGSTLDPGAVGPQRWSQLLTEQLLLVQQTLGSKGLGYLLVPLGTRTSNGYEHDEPRLELILCLLGDLGLRVLAQHQVLERRPVKRLYVGRQRPRLVSLIVQKGDG